MPLTIDLKGEVAVVTGSGSGIGLATARTLAEAGAAVGVVDIVGERAEAAAAAIADDGGTARPVQMDISSPASVDAGLAEVRGAYGRVSILVNNAAAWVIKPFADTTPEETHRVFAITAEATMEMTRRTLGDLCDGGGRVVNIVSDSARSGNSGVVSYASAKAALLGFTKSLALEVARDGVTVNGVSPGTTETESSAPFIERAGGRDRMVRLYPLRRLGQPDDIANAVAFLASPLASWITGQVLSVNGGFVMA